MCGLVGIYSSNLLARHKGVFSDLLFLDTFRGRDSTGVAAIRHNADTSILKSTVPGYEFVEGPRLENHLRLNDFCWIGHNRFGTVGRNIKTNAHPFEILDEQGSCIVVGAHNGTLKNKWALKDQDKFGTDSEALFNNIAAEGLDDTIAKVEGAWAITYYDHVAEELRILRNSERTLYYAYEEGKKTVFWASEQWMIRVATSRNGLKLEGDTVYCFAEDTLYKFPAPMKINEEITIERKGGYVGKKANTFFQGRIWKKGEWIGGQGGQAALTEANPTTQEKKADNLPPAILNTPSSTEKPKLGVKLVQTKESSSSKDSPNTNVTDISTAKKFKGYQGMPLSRKELETQLENGCAWCELEFITPEDRFAWLAPSKPVCHKCLVGTHSVEAPKLDKKSVYN